MQSSFTLQDVARYTFEVFQETQKSVLKAVDKKEPSASTISNILQYSKALAVSKSRTGIP